MKRRIKWYIDSKLQQVRCGIHLIDILIIVFCLAILALMAIAICCW